MLRPGEGRWAFLRLSGDELRQLLLFLLMIAVGIGAEIVLIIAAAIVGVGLALALAAAGLSGAHWAIVIMVVLCYAALAYFGVRLSLASPLTFDSRRVDLFGSWALTRGRFWKLLGAYLLVYLLVIIVGLLVLTISVVLGAVAGGGLGAAGTMLFHPDTSSLAAYFTPARLLFTLIWAAASALLWPLMLMPAPEIYRQLTRAEGAA